MSNRTSENLRYLLWHEGIELKDWPMQLAAWADCDRQRAKELLRGAELLPSEQQHVAETMTWALDSVYLPPSRIPNTSIAEMAAGFELLTGTSAPVLEIAPPIAAESTPIGDREVLDTGAFANGQDLG